MKTGRVNQTACPNITGTLLLSENGLSFSQIIAACVSFTLERDKAVALGLVSW